MADVTVYFATNRQPTGVAALAEAYGTAITAPTDAGAITYATAVVSGTALGQEGSGTIAAITGASQGAPDAAAAADIIGAGRNLLVFVHGFCNSFEDAIKRAAYNREWFAASGVTGADTTVLAFSWPSLGKLIAAPPHLLPDDYLADQRMAGQSGFHIASFFETIRPLIDATHAAGRRVFLLAHSMGNYALQAAVESWFAHGKPAVRLFDEVVLAAADERYDSFTYSLGARLSRLGELCGRISIYASRRDVAMYLSSGINLDQRLGFDGPEAKGDARIFPPERFRLLDATHVDDYDLAIPADASHQYYRRSVRVRTDIAAVMADRVAGGGVVPLA